MRREWNLVWLVLAVSTFLTLVWTVFALGQQQASRVEDALRATQPYYCDGSDDKMVLWPKIFGTKATGFLIGLTLHPYPAKTWYIICLAGATHIPEFTVNVSMCKAWLHHTDPISFKEPPEEISLVKCP